MEIFLKLGLISLIFKLILMGFYHVGRTYKEMWTEENVKFFFMMVIMVWAGLEIIFLTFLHLISK